MGFHIPDPRFEMPELLIPRKKPASRNVVLDKSHEICKYIDFNATLAAGFGIWMYYDYQHVVNLLNNSLETWTYVLISTYGPDYLESNGGSGYFYTGGVSPNNNNNWTQIIDITRAETGASGVQMVRDDAASNVEDRGFYFDATNNLNGYLYDGASISAQSSSTYGDGERVMAVLTANGSNMRLFVNGKDEATQAISTNGYTGFSNPEFYFARDNTRGGYGANRYRMMGMFYGALPDALALELSSDPYQFLIPA